MLARPGQPFDSPRHLFEVKWDGTRAMAFVEGGRVRLMNRRRCDVTARYPDLACLGSLPAGTVLDGEIVVLRDGKPDFPALQSREHTRSLPKIAALSRSQPATFVAFDILFDDFRPVMALPLADRRALLERTARGCAGGLVVSQGVIGSGLAYFEQVAGLGLEGVVAKRLDAPYLPGERTDAWVKIKRQLSVACVVVGFIPDPPRRDFKALIVAADSGGGRLACVGKVGSGFDGPLRARVNDYLWSHLRDAPVVPCDLKGRWTEPGLYCTVRCMERTAGGRLRAPVFGELYEHHSESGPDGGASRGEACG